MLRRLALVTLFLVGCGGDTRSPTAAVQALTDAARDGDVDQVLKLVGPKTRERLTADAKLAAQQAGRREVQPRELLAAGFTPARFTPVEVHEIARTGDSATVEAVGRHGEREKIDLVRERDGWKVELTQANQQR